MKNANYFILFTLSLLVSNKHLQVNAFTASNVEGNKPNYAFLDFNFYWSLHFWIKDLELCYEETKDTCSSSSDNNAEAKYLFYDVNPSEGFNLRRDVYIRIATLVNKLNR